MQPIRIGDTILDDNSPPLLIAGPCVIEDEDETIELAKEIVSLPATAKFLYVFKASYLKDNRSSAGSYRGPGLKEGLRVLQRIKDQVGCPVLSDVHSVEEAERAAKILDVVQVPAFLSRQTRLLEAVARSARAVNIKKGQFLSPEAIELAIEKIQNAGGKNILVTERGTSFGYNDLIVDFRGIPRMRGYGWPVIFDVTHSLQRPGSLGDRSGGEPGLARPMSRAAAALPCDGFFIETHFEPGRAKSDGASMLPFSELARLLEEVHQIFTLTRRLELEKRNTSEKLRQV
ncbi:MAG: 3-deoxy-8-phosphooctulonate synthase [Candidatus Latescibacterota bacterium]|nr:MAG: 3-deoxy-8-phosphooctulonate synthase [Candidatus Latescibacterota bacterium]